MKLMRPFYNKTPKNARNTKNLLQNHGYINQVSFLQSPNYMLLTKHFIR